MVKKSDLWFKDESSGWKRMWCFYVEFQIGTHTDGQTDHAIERVVIIILVNSQYSIFDTRYRFGLAKQGFRAYVYMIWIVLFICISYSYSIHLMI